MNQGERKLENKNFNKSMLPEEQGQELVFQEENNKSSVNIQAINVKKHIYADKILKNTMNYVHKNRIMPQKRVIRNLFMKASR